jgi:hypothetical protein
MLRILADAHASRVRSQDSRQMSNEELQLLVNEAIEKPEVLTSEGLKVAAMISEQAERLGIDCALAGGIAMHVYGFQRATKDVDLLASDILGLPCVNKLSFGGESYFVETDKKKILVDLIVRDDFFRNFYEAALQDAEEMSIGGRIITPEWMVILKFLSGRSKDIIDLLWLLKEPGKVDRNKVEQLLEKVSGKSGAQVALRGLKPYYLQADVMQAGDEQEAGK